MKTHKQKVEINWFTIIVELETWKHLWTGFLNYIKWGLDRNFTRGIFTGKYSGRELWTWKIKKKNWNTFIRLWERLTK